MAVTDAYKKIFSDVGNFIPNITIDLAARYAAAFGAMAIGRFIDKVTLTQDAEDDYQFELFPEMSDIPEYIKLEIPDLEPLEFSAVMHSERGAIFAPPLMLSISAEKTLIETEVNDDDPIVIERWGTKPWDIQMRGLLIDLENRVYPTDEIRRLTQNWKYNGVVKVVGQQFEEKDIDTIYFRSIEFSGVEGFQDTIQFNINARSIKAVNYTLLKPNK
jgi:hypothetical protein